MKRGLLCLGLCLGLVWMGSGCWEETPPTTEATQEITLPTVDEEKTPQELLQEAADKTRSLTDFTVDYVRTLGEDRFALFGQIHREAEGSYTAQIIFGSFTPEGTLESPTTQIYEGNTLQETQGDQEQVIQLEEAPTLAQMLSGIGEFCQRTDLIRQFSTYPMTVSPSEDGSLCYQLTDLSREDFALLLCGSKEAALPEATGEEIYQASLTTSETGALSKLEFQGEDVYVQLTILEQAQETVT